MTSNDKDNITIEEGDTIALKITTNGEYVSYNTKSNLYEKSKTIGPNSEFIVEHVEDGYYRFYNPKHKCVFYASDTKRVGCIPLSHISDVRLGSFKITNKTANDKTLYKIITGAGDTIVLVNKKQKAYLKYGQYDSNLGVVQHKGTPTSFNAELFLPEIVSKRVIIDDDGDEEQKKINERIRDGKLSDEEKYCYLQRYPEIAKEVGGASNFDKGQQHWKHIGRWKSLNPLCDIGYTPEQYAELQKKNDKAMNKIDIKKQTIKKLNSESKKMDETISSLQEDETRLYDLLYGTPDSIENFENYKKGKEYSLYEGLGLYNQAIDLYSNIESKKRDLVTNKKRIRRQKNKNMKSKSIFETEFRKLEDDNKDEDIIENMQNGRDNYKHYLKMIHQEITDIDNQNKFLEYEMANHINGNTTFERKSEFKKNHKTYVEYVNQYFLFYIYAFAALFVIYLIIFKIKDIPRYLIVLFTIGIVIYPFYIYSLEQYISKYWNFIYSNFVGEPTH
jgi:hypothetical protein